MTITHATKKAISKGKPNAVTVSKTRHLEIREQPSKSRDRLVSELAVDGVVANASTLELFSRGVVGEISFTDCVAVLNEKGAAVNRGDMRACEVVLTAQAAALNAIFNELARRAVMNMGEHLGATETYLRLAMKAQSQCRSTIETLSEMKSPPVVFARQANITSGPQQVNNGIGADPERSVSPHPHVEEKQNLQIKELELTDGKWLDTGATGSTIGTDPHLEAVGKSNRTDKRRR